MDPVDALGASPFALLDAHGSLRLVTETVHEDDALCLALACRALRDALWARFPARPVVYLSPPRTAATAAAWLWARGREGKRLRTRDVALAKLGAAVTADGVLDLSATRLRALPAGIGRLVYLPAPGLKKLNLSYNGGLSEADALPEGLCLLARLEELHLGNCNLRALPEGIGGLAGLRKLDLSYNRGLTALPVGLCALVGLEELILTNCPGLMALPEGIGGLVGLRNLDLMHSSLVALPEGIGGLRGLRKLNLGSNRELVALPEGLCALAGLEVLHLFDCGLTVLPEGIGRLAGLQKLDLRYNTGLTALPAGLGRLRNLHTLIIAYGCPGLAALSDLQRREGLPALVAHLAAQGQPPVAAEVSYPVA